MKTRIYIDANATVPLAEGVLDVASRAVSGPCNPSSIHHEGQQARALIERARGQVAEASGAGSGWEVVFTSGATEANYLPLHSFLQRHRATRVRLITSAIEHAAVLEPVRSAPGDVERVFVAPHSDNGQFIENVLRAVGPEPTFVSLMLANNETGQIFPIAETFAELRRRTGKGSLHCHTDLAQALGKLTFRVDDLHADSAALSAHKIGGLGGCGAMLLRSGVAFEPLFRGGPQETRRRAGTENVLGIVAFGVAAERRARQLVASIQSMRESCEKFEARVVGVCGIERVNVGFQTLPNTLSLYVPGVLADDFVVAADLLGLALSAGAACSSGKPQPSHVLRAMGLPESIVRSTVRVSFLERYQSGEIEEAARRFCEVVERMQALREVA